MAYENERAEREFRMNPPESAPGQGGDDDWGDIGVGSSSVESLSDSIITGGVNSQQLVGSTIEEQKPLENKDAIKNYTATEDMVIEKATVAVKGVWSYFKALSDSLRNNSSGDWHDLGVRVSKISLGGVIVGLIFVVVNLFSGRNNQPLDVVIGSLMSAIVGVGLCMWFDKEPAKPLENEPQSTPMSGEDDGADLSQWGALEDAVYDEEYTEEDEYSEEVSDDEISDEDWALLMGGNINAIEEVSIESGDFSVEDELEKVTEIPYGTQTRRYLYETFSRVLPKMTPSFSEMRFISKDSDDFYFFESLIREAAYQVGTKDENLPELDTVYVNDFIYRLNCTRPVGLKEQLIADEVASTYSRDENNMEIRVGVYATTETSTGKYTINLFKGELKKDSEMHKTSIKISLGDIYRDIENFIVDVGNVMPFVWGVNEFGKPIFSDIGDTNSFICSGEPRGGKSWKGQSLLAQLCMFNSPKEIEFYVFDCKNRQSDYRYAASVLPHIRYFCGDPNKVNEGIERVLNKAVTERERILSDNGCINIKDYNSKFPNNKLPYMYIIVDELMALMEHFSLNDMKEEANRFKGFLSVMVSKLANMGVRFILFPHRIVDSVISKNTYSLISTRMVVNQSNPDDLKSALDITSKTFPYKLVSPGDMALRSKDIERGKVVYCHAEMLTSSNENNCKMFDFIGSVWRKLEPECTCIDVKGTICGTISINGPEKKATEKYKVEDIDNTNGKPSYEYTGYGEDNGGSTTEEILEEFEGQDHEVDETFWNNFS